MTSALSDIMRRCNKWRLALALFLIIYAVLLLTELGYSALLWDETPHMYGGLLLSRGQFQEYIHAEAFYPPIFNAVTGLFFKILGANIFSARLVAVTFSILSVWTVFEFGYRLYGPRTAMLASVMLASMPGFLWISRMALLETMLLFSFSISLLLFYLWIRTDSNKLLILCGVTLGLGFLVKYQALVSGVIMLLVMFIFERRRLATRRLKFLLLIVITGAVIAPWFVLTYQLYASEMLGKWFYVLQMGNEGRLAYSTRFPVPIFYLIEMTQPYPHIHPIYLPVYILSLLGLGLWAWRRSEADKFSLLSFSVVYIVFTLITSKDWRYVTLVFPVLAVSGSEFVFFLWDKTKEKWKAKHISLRKKNMFKVAAAALVLFVSVSIVCSAWRAYVWVERDYVNIPIDKASQYVAEHTTLDDKVVVLCGGNFFSVDMVEFYLLVSDPNREQPTQYPDLPIDAYTPSFNMTWLIEYSEASGVKYLMLYEHGNITFYQSELRSHDVLETMLDTDQFIVETEFGAFPRRIFIIRFLSGS